MSCACESKLQGKEKENRAWEGARNMQDRLTDRFRRFLETIPIVDRILPKGHEDALARLENAVLVPKAKLDQWPIHDDKAVCQQRCLRRQPVRQHAAPVVTNDVALRLRILEVRLAHRYDELGQCLQYLCRAVVLEAVAAAVAWEVEGDQSGGGLERWRGEEA